MSSKQSVSPNTLSFSQFLQLVEEGDYIVKDYCTGITDPKLRRACRKLYKKTPNNRTYGGGWG